MIELNDLLAKVDLDPATVMVMRHRPDEPALRRALPTLAAERRAVFDAYQSQHAERTEKALARAGYLASFFGHEPGRALFTGLYEVAGHERLDEREFWKIPQNQELRSLGSKGPKPGEARLWFDLRGDTRLAGYIGRLVIRWPGIERSWWRWSDRNRMEVHCIHEEGRLVRPMPPWNEISLGWSELGALPRSWRESLAEWRGVYFVFDARRKLGYVGSAYGAQNLLGRWLGYSASGHGGNKLLRQSEKEDLVFSILERVSPDLAADDVIAVESRWKRRLQTRHPNGLNEN